MIVDRQERAANGIRIARGDNGDEVTRAYLEPDCIGYAGESAREYHLALTLYGVQVARWRVARRKSKSRDTSWSRA